MQSNRPPLTEKNYLTQTLCIVSNVLAIAVLDYPKVIFPGNK